MGNYDYLMETLDEAANQGPEQDSLARLKALVDLYKEQKEAVETLEEELSQAKNAFYKTSKELIPNLLMQNGLSEIKLPTGEKVQVKMDVSPTITDMEAFSKFLDERGESNILKTQMELGKLDGSIVRKIKQLLIENLDMYPDIKQTVHPMTLKAYIKNLCLLNEQDPSFDGYDHIALQDLPKCISAFTYYNTTIKRSK